MELQKLVGAPKCFGFPGASGYPHKEEVMGLIGVDFRGHPIFVCGRCGIRVISGEPIAEVKLAGIYGMAESDVQKSQEEKK